jgi:hypothetical protein
MSVNKETENYLISRAEFSKMIVNEKIEQLIKNKEDIKKYNFFFPKGNGCNRFKYYLTKFQLDFTGMFGDEEIDYGAVFSSERRSVFCDDKLAYYSKNLGVFVIESGIFIKYNNAKIIYWEDEIEDFFEKMLEKNPEPKAFLTTYDGKVKAINNRYSNSCFSPVFSEYSIKMVNKAHFLNELKYHISLGLIYVSDIGKNKKAFKLKIENDLENIADELNVENNIDWKNENQRKYFIYYDFNNETLKMQYTSDIKSQGTIYCLDERFLDIAIEKIGKDNLVKYFKEQIIF